ncbi:transcriptional repressor DicA [Haploplasma axanthum]|uniref:Transcriptional repressor DicA n=2 Tax=Haploplasma axanthum TaxID=29552 RepID=A0A449BFD5_HAPAX|nr:transcriptional repressor DicA [Haploplasma axanthum]
MNQEKIAKQIADNIIYYRKKFNLTQADLAEKLNYSDKSISKWERSEGIPSVLVLKELADFFGISLDDMLSDKKVKSKLNKGMKRYTVAYFYASIVIVLAGIAYGILSILQIDYTAWHLFIYALPVSSLVLMIFSIVWKKRFISFIYTTTFIWTAALSLFISIDIPNKYWIFIIVIPIYFFVIYLMHLINIKRFR